MSRSREGTIFQRKDGRWVASVELPQVAGKRRRRTIYADTEAEAKRARRKLLRELDEGRLGDDATVRQWLDYWLAEVAPEKASGRTVANYSGHVRNWIAPTLGRIRLADLQVADVRRLKRLLESSPRKDRKGQPLMDADGEPRLLTSTTVRAVLVTLTAALRSAHRENRINWNPALPVAKPEVTGHHHPHLTAEQARAMIDGALDAEEQARHAVLIYGGLRLGEALALEWDAIDLDGGTLSVHQTAAPVKGGGMVVTPGAKTAYSVRTIPLHPVLRATLAQWQAQARGRYVFGGDQPMSLYVAYRRWRDAAARIGVTDVSPHGARATTAVLLRAAGVPLSTIGEILGHKPGSDVTALSYAHAQLPELAAAIERLPDWELPT